jgi:hypothetical protein
MPKCLNISLYSLNFLIRIESAIITTSSQL